MKRINEIKTEIMATEEVIRRIKEEYNSYLDTGREKEYYVRVLEDKINRERGYILGLEFAIEILKKT